MWNFFAEVTNNGVTSIVDRGDVIRKINFPKYVIVLAGSISALINMLINMVVIIVFMIINGVDVHWVSLLAPLYVFELFVLALGLAFFLSAMFVRLRDLNYIWEIIMQGLFYASIIIYPVSMIIAKSHILAELLLLNPVAQSVQDARQVLISNANPTLYTVSGNNIFIAAIPIVLVLLIFVVGARYFKRKSPYFAENV